MITMAVLSDTQILESVVSSMKKTQSGLSQHKLERRLSTAFVAKQSQSLEPLAAHHRYLDKLPLRLQWVSLASCELHRHFDQLQ